MTTVTKRVCLVSLCVAIATCAYADTSNDLGHSPNGTLSLVLKKSGDGQPLSLHLVETVTSTTVTSVPLEASPLNELKPVWSNRNDAVAVAVDYGTTNSKTIGFLRLSDGQFQSLIFNDQGNLGKLGERHDHWKKIRNFPVAWDTMRNSYGYRFVDIKTQVWDKAGQRFTVVESVGITTGGLITGR